MKLEQIKQENCDCGAPTVYEECTHHHCNGQGFERRKFKCGAILSWSPNFERLEWLEECPNSVNAVARRKLREAAKRSVLAYIDTLDVDGEWADRIKQLVERGY